MRKTNKKKRKGLKKEHFVVLSISTLNLVQKKLHIAFLLCSCSTHVMIIGNSPRCFGQQRWIESMGTNVFQSLNVGEKRKLADCGLSPCAIWNDVDVNQDLFSCLRRLEWKSYMNWKTFYLDNGKEQCSFQLQSCLFNKEWWRDESCLFLHLFQYWSFSLTVNWSNGEHIISRSMDLGKICSQWKNKAEFALDRHFLSLIWSPFLFSIAPFFLFISEMKLFLARWIIHHTKSSLNSVR